MVAPVGPSEYYEWLLSVWKDTFKYLQQATSLPKDIYVLMKLLKGLPGLVGKKVDVTK